MPGAQNVLDRAHRFAQARLLVVGKRAKRACDFVVLAAFERRKGIAPLRGEEQVALATVAGRTLLANQTAPYKIAQDAAEITVVELELLAEFRRSEVVFMREFVEHVCFRERERALEKILLQRADVPGVEPIESPDTLNGQGHSS